MAALSGQHPPCAFTMYRGGTSLTLAEVARIGDSVLPCLALSVEFGDDPLSREYCLRQIGHLGRRTRPYGYVPKVGLAEGNRRLRATPSRATLRLKRHLRGSARDHLRRDSGPRIAVPDVHDVFRRQHVRSASPSPSATRRAVSLCRSRRNRSRSPRSSHGTWHRGPSTRRSPA